MIDTNTSKFLKSMNKAQKYQDQIRNIAISGFFDNGQKYLFNNLIQKWGISNHTDKVHNDELEFEQEFYSQCNLKSMYYKQLNINKGEEEGFLIYLIKSTNKYHKQPECLSRLSDGAIIIINFGFEICSEIETIIRTFLKEQNRLVFFINKLDKAFLKFNLDGEKIYLNMNYQIERINQIKQLYEQDKILTPADGSIIFGSAKQGWGFSCVQFALFYEKKFGIEHKRLAEKLWGDHYFDAQTKQWSNQGISKESQLLKRAFVAFILDPIMKLSQAIMNGHKDVVYQMTDRIGIQLTDEIKVQEGKQLLKSIFNIWINLADTIMQQCIHHIPSPRIAQQYRAPNLFTLSNDHILNESIKNCNPKGPLAIQICFMIPHKQELIAIGRVFSGTISIGQEIRIHGSLYQFLKNSYNWDDYKYEEIEELPYQRIDQTFQSAGQTFCFPIGEPTLIEQVPSGNIVGIKGIDKFFKGTCTITELKNTIVMTPFQSQSNYQVKISIAPVNPQNLNILMEAIKQLNKQHPTISLELNPSLILVGNSYHHLQYFLQQLKDRYLKNVEIRTSQYIINYQETIKGISNQNEAKTDNQHNTIVGEAIPLSENFINQIELNNKSFNKELDIKQIDLFEGEVIAFGPNNIGPNILINKSSPEESYHLFEIEDYWKSAWQEFTKRGALCEERLRGVQFNILKFISPHPNHFYRGSIQIIPAAMGLFCRCQLQAKPRLEEPIFLVEIYSNISVIDQVYTCLNNSKAIVIEEKSFPDTSSQNIKAYVKGPNIFQFHDQLTLMTQNKASSFSQLDHWSLINSDPLEQGSEANQIMLDIRRQKCLQIQNQGYI